VIDDAGRESQFLEAIQELRALTGALRARQGVQQRSPGGG